MDAGQGWVPRPHWLPWSLVVGQELSVCWVKDTGMWGRALCLFLLPLAPRLDLPLAVSRLLPPSQRPSISLSGRGIQGGVSVAPPGPWAVWFHFNPPALRVETKLSPPLCLHLELPVGPQVTWVEKVGFRQGRGALVCWWVWGLPGPVSLCGVKPHYLGPAPMGCDPGTSTREQAQARRSWGEGQEGPMSAGQAGLLWRRPLAGGHRTCRLLWGRGM